MKKVSIILAIIIPALQGCFDETLEAPSLQVFTEKQVYGVGEEVHFSFAGNPEVVLFFSGEPKHKFEFRDRTEADGIPVVSFRTSAANGDQVNSLSLLVSTDFNGDYSSEGVQAATWTDITSQAVLSQGAANVDSGDIDLSSFSESGRCYLAFRFTGTQSETSAQRKWTISNFLLTNVTDEGASYTIYPNISSPVWRSVDLANSDRSWSASSSQLTIDGGGVNTADNEDWIITSATNLKTVQPDTGVPMKNIATRLKDFEYTYNQEGIYQATFLGQNIRVDESRSVVREVELSIEP